MCFCRSSRHYLETAEVQRQLAKAWQQQVQLGNIFDLKQGCFFVWTALGTAGRGRGWRACAVSSLDAGLRPSGRLFGAAEPC